MADSSNNIHMKVGGPDDPVNKEERLKGVFSLDKQIEEDHPETKADAGYDDKVTCATPLKYIMQKWCCRRKRQVRYKVDNAQLNNFDERRLIDCRFWLVLGNISNGIFMINNTLKPTTPY